MSLTKYAQKLQDYLKMYNLLASTYKTRVNEKHANIENGKGLFSDLLLELIEKQGEGTSLATAIQEDIIDTLWDQFNASGDGFTDFVTANIDAFIVNPGVTISVGTPGVNAIAEVTNITCVLDVADSLNGTYFTINSPTVAYYVWYKTSGGVLTDPAVAASTGIQVNIATGATAAQVATATALAIDALAAFVCPAPGAAIITVTNAVAGVATDATVATSGFSRTVTTQGAAAVAEVTSITCSADDTHSLNGKYFLLNSPTVEYYVWWEVTGAEESLDPELEDKTGIKVTIDTDSTAIEVAVATAAILNAHAAFAVPVPVISTLVVTNSVAGATVDAIGDIATVIPENIITSQGELLGFDTLAVDSADASSNLISISWTDNSDEENALATDEVFVVVYNETQDYWTSEVTAATREDEAVTITDATMATSDVIHVYVSLKSATNDQLVSNSERVEETVVA